MIANHRIQVLVSLAIVSAAPIAAADVTKEECLDAHSKGQDAREQGKLSLARKLFMTCAQPACPALVQADCSRFADDLAWNQPSVSFAARDAAGNDLPDTAVYVDDILVTTRLDDGRPHDVDPGTHRVRFTNGGREQTVVIVVNAGEKARPIVASFGGGKPAAGPAPAPARKEPVVRHPTGSRVLIIGGTVGVASGLVLGIIGLARMPSGCSLSSHQCSAAPGDPAFNDASSAARMIDYGWALGGAGVAALAGGFAWYVRSAETVKETTVVSPWFGHGSAGLAITGAL